MLDLFASCMVRSSLLPGWAMDSACIDLLLRGACCARCYSVSVGARVGVTGYWKDLYL